ncbi:serine/threonine protein phosphatase [Bacillus sp. BRMEA1]|uniref:metallophosphoesterase family protein n=1 Tax=Neobacillus endophyticus TaxID=2738405 RepID=UPI0015641EA4|nr:metallophosphoesterase family protein [Neobacillus endophyticus]NRD80140.1 serine/threonine protein phosphatase [Neobacillus endophyticus]
MKRKFAISDVHGQFDSMIILLNEANFDPKYDQLVFVGDMIDRGPDSVGVIKYVKHLQEQHPKNVFVVLGNHEVMMRRYLFRGYNDMWLRYGGQEVIQELKRRFVSKMERDEHLVWLANLPITYCDEQYFYTHAGINLNNAPLKQHEDCTFMGIDEMYSVNQNDLNKAIGGRIMVHGHTPYLSVYRAGNFISCDTGASVLPNGKLSLVDLTGKKYYCNVSQTPEVLKIAIKEMDITKRIKIYTESGY